MIRYFRMKGRPALWIPGTDHAGIATQVCRSYYTFTLYSMLRFTLSAVIGYFFFNFHLYFS
jgi:hypothetical protein